MGLTIAEQEELSSLDSEITKRDSEDLKGIEETIDNKLLNEYTARNLYAKGDAEVTAPIVEDTTKTLEAIDYNRDGTDDTPKSKVRGMQESNGFMGVAYKLQAINTDMKIWAVKGAGLGVLNTLKGIGTLTGAEDTEAYRKLEDYTKALNDYLPARTGLQKFSETVGQVGIGLLGTKGMGATAGSRIAQGAGIDFFVFEAKEDNVADVLEDWGMKNIAIDYLKTDMSDSELLGRTKNALSGGVLSGAFEVTLGSLKLAKNFLKDQGRVYQGTDVELSNKISSLTASEDDMLLNDGFKGAMKQSEDVANTQSPFIKASMTEAERNAETAKIVQDMKNPAKVVDEVPVGQTNAEFIQSRPLNYMELTLKRLAEEGKDIGTTDIQGKARELLAHVDDTKVSAVNVDKMAIGEGESVLKDVAGDIESTIEVMTNKQIMEEADKTFSEMISKESFSLMEFLTESTRKFSGITLNMHHQRIMVGTLAQNLEHAIGNARQIGGGTGLMKVMTSLHNLSQATQVLKNSQHITARLLSSLNQSTEMARTMKAISLLDEIDPDATILHIKKLMGSTDADAVEAFLKGLGDSTTNMKKIVENFDDTLYNKITNVLSEGTVAWMLTSPSTLAVNLVGNSIVKHLTLAETSVGFLLGQVFKGTDSMKWREYKALMQSGTWYNFKDSGIAFKNLYKWASSNLDEDIYNKGILAPFKQDQDTAKHYISSEYLMKPAEATDSALRNQGRVALDVAGRYSRSSFRLLGAGDDYYKRLAFRHDLIRQASTLADARKITDEAYPSFIENFIKDNTELKMMRNEGLIPDKSKLEAMKGNVGTGRGIFKYIDRASDYANKMTFQEELGDGLVGGAVQFLNRDGLLRIAIPFKMTPINILKKSISIMHDPIRGEYLNTIVTKPTSREAHEAMSKIIVSGNVVYQMATLASTGQVTGTFNKDNRDAMKTAGIPEQSVKIGGTWYEYKQIEPLATILGLIVDINRDYKNAQYKLDDAELLDTYADTMQDVLGGLALDISKNITEKTYAKSLSEFMLMMTGEQSLVDYTGKAVSSMTPFSGLTNYLGRVSHDEYKKEATTFLEKARSKHKYLLDRDALDSFGRPIKEEDYLFGFTIKTREAGKDEDRGAREVARLEIPNKPMGTTISYSVKGVSIPIKLDEVQHHIMRSSLHTEFDMAGKINKLIDSKAYTYNATAKRPSNDEEKKMILTDYMTAIKKQASDTIIATDPKILKSIKGSISVKVKDLGATAQKATWNNLGEVFDGK